MSGYCNYFGTNFYDTWSIRDIFLVMNKVARIIILITYLYYFYKCRNSHYNKHLLPIAITMGANIGVSHFLLLYGRFGSEADRNLTVIVGTILNLIQEYVIMFSFMCTPKMKKLCKEYYLRN